MNNLIKIYKTLPFKFRLKCILQHYTVQLIICKHPNLTKLNPNVADDTLWHNNYLRATYLIKYVIL